MRLIVVLALIAVAAYCHPASPCDASTEQTEAPVVDPTEDQEFTTYERRQRRSPCSGVENPPLRVIVKGYESEPSEGSGSDVEERIVKRSFDEGFEEHTEEGPDVGTEGSGTLVEERIVKRSFDEDDEEVSEEDSEDQEFTTYERRQRRSNCREPNPEEEPDVDTEGSGTLVEDHSEASEGSGSDVEEPIVKRSAEEGLEEGSGSEPTEEEPQEEGPEPTGNEEETQEGTEVAPTEQPEEGSGESEEDSDEESDEDSEEDTEEGSRLPEQPEEGTEHTEDPAPTEVITWELPETTDGAEPTDAQEGSEATEQEEEGDSEPSEGTEPTGETIEEEQRVVRSAGRTRCRPSANDCPAQEPKRRR